MFFEGSECMYLTGENIHSLEEIIVNLNMIQNEEEKKEFLNKHVEDSALFLATLKKINKSKIPKNHEKNQKDKLKVTNEILYNEDDIISIFKEKSDNDIINKYSLNELKQMYNSVYNRKAPSNYTKGRIVSILRDRFHTMNRVSAFTKMAEEREKNRV